MSDSYKGLDVLPDALRQRLEKFLVDQRVVTVQTAPSAQQRVYIVQSEQDNGNRNYIVVRQWQGGSRWWNLHQARHVSAVAQAESTAYRVAYQAWDAAKETSHPSIIPQLLWYSGDASGDTVRQSSVNTTGNIPWAILEYVGPHSARFASKHNVNRSDSNPSHPSSSLSSSSVPPPPLVYDESWTTNMTRIRHEFGFDEPHPRWGRVPVGHCWEYAQMVLEQVIVPLHRRCGPQPLDVRVRLCDNDAQLAAQGGYTYQSMVEKYRTAVDAMSQAHAANDDKVIAAISTLHQCVAQLERDAIDVQDLPSVLVHMDLQPQNLVFGRCRMNPTACQTFSTRETATDKWCIAAVLDWEDAAYADPRFELLLLGRKVSRKDAGAQVRDGGLLS